MTQRPRFHFYSGFTVYTSQRKVPFGSMERERHRDSHKATGTWAGLVFSARSKIGAGENPTRHKTRCFRKCCIGVISMQANGCNKQPGRGAAEHKSLLLTSALIRQSRSGSPPGPRPLVLSDRGEKRVRGTHQLLNYQKVPHPLGSYFTSQNQSPGWVGGNVVPGWSAASQQQLYTLGE